LAAARPHLIPAGRPMTDEMQVEITATLLDLVKNVAAMDAKLGTVDEEIKKLRCEVGKLQSQTTNITAVARAAWVVIGLAVGAGGLGAFQALL